MSPRLHRGLAALVLLAVALAPSAALAHSHKKKGLELVHPHTFATPEKGGTAAVFMVLKNRSGAPDRLLRATTTTAASAELRDGAGEAAAPTGKPITAIAVPAGADVDLKPKGGHIVLKGVKKRLNAYDSFKLTLEFERAGRVVVDVMVEEAPE